MPDYWEISGDNSGGQIHDLYRERGKIFYAEPAHRRLVKIVDWYDERGTVRSSDHYNRYGALYARTIFNGKGQRVNRSWFAADGREVIVLNFVTGDIIFNDRDQVRFFRDKTEFVIYVLRSAGFEDNRIFYNSLSTPFFVSQRLYSPRKRDVLFWQEPVNGDIPGNMQVILRGEASRTAKIMVQKNHAYEELLRLGASEETVGRLGFVYPFVRENRHRREALICTNSDEIHCCRELVEALPQMRFHIAALTEMSEKLTSMESYGNVSLYPGVRMSVLEELFETCDYYLDINRESEIVSAVYRAFLHNHLIFAFEETMHNRDYVAAEHIYASHDVREMIGDIKLAIDDERELDRRLGRQRKEALAESEGSYRQFEDRRRRAVRENPPVAMYITNVYGPDPGREGAGGQKIAAKIARELGFVEMPVPRYLPDVDGKGSLRRQVEGVAAAVKDRDIVVFQSPSWNGPDYDKALMEEFRRRRDIRLVMFIHDVPPMRFGGTEEEYRQAAEIYNMADVVIVPTESMVDFLRKKGLRTKKVLIQPMWDLPFSGELGVPRLERRIVFSGSPEEFGFISSWDQEVLLDVFTDEETEPAGRNVRVEGWRNKTELLSEYARGGFGLVWEGSVCPDYDRCSQSHRLSQYLAAGIPVIMEKGFTHEQTVQEYGLGFVVASLKEAAEVVKNISEEEYRQKRDNIKNISRLIRGGFFTKKLLIDAVNYLMLG